LKPVGIGTGSLESVQVPKTQVSIEYPSMGVTVYSVSQSLTIYSDPSNLDYCKFD